MAIKSIKIGEKYKLKKPKFAKTYGQGEPPKGMKINGIFVEWGAILIAKEGMINTIEIASPYLYADRQFLEMIQNQVEHIPSRKKSKLNRSKIMSKELSGFTKVEIENSTGIWVGSQIDLGEPLEDGGDAKEIAEKMNAAGKALFAGHVQKGEFHITDMSKLSTLETKMEADTEVDIRITVPDGTTHVIATNVLIKATPLYKNATGDVNAIKMTWTGFKTT